MKTLLWTWPENGARSSDGEPVNDAAEQVGPVTISISRRILPGREADYEAWVQGITAEALKFPGHMGVNVIRPCAPSLEYVTIFRFDSYQHSRDWEESTVRADWLARLKGITAGEDAVQKGTGLEFWFSLPELPATHPSPHKMALVLLIVVFLLVLAINFLLGPFMTDWPLVGRVFVAVFLQVILMTYIVMPRVTRLLKRWLYGTD